MDEDEILAGYTTNTNVHQNAHVLQSAHKKKEIKSVISHSTAFSPRTGSTPKYNDRKTKGEIVTSFGRKFTVRALNNDQPFVKISIHNSADLLTKRFSYMYQTPYDIMMAISNRLDDLAEITLDSLEASNSEISWSSVDSIDSEPVYIYGAVQSCDESAKVDANCALLQGSWSSSAGQTVQLDLSSVSNYSIFSGQFLAVRGVNPTGKRFIADEIIPQPLPSRPRKIDVTPERTIFLASGPFTTADNLDFQPLQDFMNVVLQNPPDLIILIGPFLPEKHAFIQKNLVSMAHAKMLDILVSRYLIQPLENTRTKVIIVSSSKDVTCDPIYPCPPYNLHRPTDNRILFVPDPCIVNVDEFLIALTATDVLFDLSREESSNSETNRMSRLIDHLMRQRSFYPPYPPNEDLNVDFAQAIDFCHINVLPDFLFVPSSLRQFILDVNDVCCINPGFLSKGEGAGTYCRMQITPNGGFKSVGDYVSAEIVRI